MRTLLTIALFIGCVNISLGQVPSNNCGTNAANEYPVATSCVPITMNSTNSSNSLPPGSGCGAANVDDAWCWFDAVSTSTTVTYNPTTRNAILNVYSGGCGALTQVGCSNVGGNGVPETVTFASTPGTRYRVRIQRAGSNNNMAGTLCIVDNIGTPTQGDTECWALPETVGASCSFTTYDNTGMTTSGTAPAPGCANFVNSDMWFVVEVPASGNLEFETSAGTITDGGLAIYSGTDCSPVSLVACNDDGGVGFMSAISASGLTPGDSIYIRVWEWGGGTGTFGLCVWEPAPPGPGDTECTAIQETVGASCSFTTYDNTGMTTSGSAPAPGCANFVNSDIWFVVEVPASGNLEFETSAGTITDGGLAIYSGTDCSPLSLVACNDDGGVGFMSAISASGLTPGDSIYIRVWEWGGGTGTFGLCVWDPCFGGIPANNTPCTATAVTAGGSVTGENNTCADGTGDPATPSCFTVGSSNTLWYSIMAPASGDLLIGVTDGTLASSQIAIFSGTCGSLTEIGCSRVNSVGCGATPLYDTDLSVTGLTPGNTYFISVDGQNSNTGSYDINFIDGGGTPIPAQDCTAPIPICNSTMNIGNPGYNATGNICDFDGSQDCTSGERNSVWYQIDVLNSGPLNFTIMPNDGGPASCGAETDYDFVMWRTVSGSGSDPVEDCSTFSTSNAGLVACNFNFRGVTGVAAGGNAPAPINGCFDAAYEPTVNAVAGDQYYLVVQNFTGSTQGFTLDFSGSGAGVIDYTGTPSVVGWTGGTDTDWENSGNWGSCSAPSCLIDAVVIGGVTNQPVLTGVHNVQDLTINAGATLTLNSGAVLNVCGDFVNNGTIVADPNSVIMVNGIAVDQNFSGSLTGGNALGIFVVSKTSNTVFFNSAIETQGAFSTISATSVIDANDNAITVGSDVTLFNPGTLTDVDDGTFTFNGGAAQNFTTNGDLFLNDVVINGVQVNLNDNLVCDADGTLTLTNGFFVTGANRVDLYNTASGAVGAGSVASYVQGNLRRYITGSTGYDFPVGEPVGGYQRANITFTTATTINYLDGRFDAWSGAPPGGLGANECIAANYNVGALDNGFFTIDASNTPTSGIYDVILYNTAGTFTNSGTASGWTVQKNSGTGWGLDGTCDPASTVTQVGRFGLNGFSTFATAQNGGTSPLPVSLISFDGIRTGRDNLLTWVTETETNNSHFEVERSLDGANFEKIGVVLGGVNSTTPLYYEFLDINQTASAYYRLRQVDLNSDYSFSDVIWIEGGTGDDDALLAYPNPISDHVNIVTGEFENEAFIQLYNIRGKLILEERLINNKKGIYRLNFELYESGSYFIRYINGSTVKTTTVIKD